MNLKLLIVMYTVSITDWVDGEHTITGGENGSHLPIVPACFGVPH